ncbi:PrpF domain-containing protein [Streptacidiphilus sp. N1-12]|uniref:PrpF domain-containing protein n=2 Tax=Streptacidiphilus alkalitolerans TaxID=3342712 RepID=A0ABV6W776_9ACTN
MDTAPATGLTLALAERSAALSYGDLPDDVVQLARQCLLDWFGVTLGGSAEDGPLILLDLLPSADPGDPRSATVVGHGRRLPTLQAALVNGTSSHRLDFDDVNAAFLGHVSVAVAGAVLALAEQRDATGPELVTAFVTGYETACRVALAIGPQPYLRGFHSTGTVGTFGAAAACARLLGLEAERTAVAFGLAASQAAGLKSNLGTMTKSFHAGKACENGLLAALMAERGFSAGTDAIEHSQGFAATAGGVCDREAALGDPPSGWHLRDNLFKYHASCFMTHSMIDGIRGLCASDRIDVRQVSQVTVHVGELELGACAVPEPATGLEVKFSLVHLAAMALLGRGTAVIDDADAADPEVVALRSRVVLAEDGVSGGPTRVDIALHDGTVLHAAHDVSTPESDLAAQQARLRGKFRGLAVPVLGAARADALLEVLCAPGPPAGARQLLALARRPDGGQATVRSVLMRAGTSKGLFFHQADLPAPGPARDALLKRLMGSPDVLQIDGLGGSRPITSKVAIVAPSDRADADVDYTFAQVDIEGDGIGYGGNCGNISSGVGPFAVDEGLVPAVEGRTRVRIHNTNTGKLIVAEVPVRNGRAEVDGDYAVPGVPGTGAEIVMDWASTIGAKTGRLLPTGSPVDSVTLRDGRVVEVTLCDAGNPVVWVRAADLGRTGSESAEEIDQDSALLDTLREIRGRVTALLLPGADWRRVDDPASPGLPLIGLVAPPADYRTLGGGSAAESEMDLRVRLVFMNRLHESIAGTASISLAAASRVKGSVVASVALNRSADTLLIGHPSGVTPTRVRADTTDQAPYVRFDLLGFSRTARRLMDGTAYYPSAG